MIVTRRRIPLEIVVTVVAVRDWHSATTDIDAATAAVDAGLSGRMLRQAGFRLLGVEGIEPFDPMRAALEAAGVNELRETREVIP